MRVIILLFAVILASSAFATDYHFELVDSVVFPINAKYINHQIIDWDNDGLHEMLITYEYSTYLYSLFFDSVVFKDSSVNYPFVWFGTVRAVDYNSDPGLELLIFGGNDPGVNLFLQTDLLSIPQEIFSTIGSIHPNFDDPDATLYYGDIDNDDDKELILNYLGFNFINYNYQTQEEEWEYSGNMISLNVDDFSANWVKDWRHNGLKNAEYIDLDSNNEIDIVAWGEYVYYKYYKVYGPPDYYDWILREWEEFKIYNFDGTQIFPTFYCEKIGVLTGQINNVSLGDDIVVFKDGYFHDTTVFMPSDLYGIYCLSYFDDSLQLAWAFDSYAEQDNLFQIKSVPNSFCASNNVGSFDLYDGNTGTKMGEVHGLNNRRVTEEGHFIESDDSTIQLIQINGKTVYLYQLASMTDIDELPIDLLPNKFELSQNHPNPFNPSTTIEFSLPEKAVASVEIFNILGQSVKLLLNKELPAGKYDVNWDGTNQTGEPVSAGIYLYRLKAGDFSDTKKMILVK